MRCSSGEHGADGSVSPERVESIIDHEDGRAVSLFCQFFDCRRQNSVPVKIPNPFLFARNLIFATTENPGAGKPVACSTTKEAMAGTL
jgi:hypothetical protein